MYKQFIEPVIRYEDYDHIKSILNQVSYVYEVKEKTSLFIDRASLFFDKATIARWLGVSLRTVYRLYNEHNSVSDEMYAQLRQLFTHLNNTQDYITFKEYLNRYGLKYYQGVRL